MNLFRENEYNHSLKHSRPRAFRQPDDDEPGTLTTGQAETYVKSETERAVAARLAAFEALDPSQVRPMPKPSPLARVDFIDL
jgi:hypothetical protein